jgi:hypothetical protein
MWYNEQLKSRGNNIFNTNPSRRDLSADNTNESPIDGWEWHATPPQWYIDANPEEFPVQE